MPCKILVIDDQLDTLQKAYGRYGMHFDGHARDDIAFYGLSDPKDVLTQITELQPDAISLDIHFMDPNITGQKILEKIKKYYPYMPIIMMTGAQDIPGQDTNERNYWQADALLDKWLGEEEGDFYRCLINTCQAAIRYHGIADDFSNDSRVHAGCVAHLATVQPGFQPELFFLQGDFGTGKRLFALEMQRRLDLEHLNVLTEINCASDCLGKNPDFLQLFSSAGGRVLFLRDTDKVPQGQRNNFIAAIQNWQNNGNWVVAATSGPTLFGQDIEIVFGQNVRTVSFPSLQDRLGAGNQPSFGGLCEETVDRRQIFKEESRNSLQDVLVTRSDILWLLALHEWPGNIRELEEVLNNAAYDAAPYIQTGDIRYRSCGVDESICRAAEDIANAAPFIQTSDQRSRHLLVGEYRKTPDSIRELLTRCCVKWIHQRQDPVNMEDLIENFLGGNYESWKRFGVMREINARMNKARTELEDPDL